ncbi:MAG: biotin/lipoyl-binding protein, partial [Gammaproteobacteria bacterium]|nr:biotin/lipoyl-binding protein [Gammaproteobacteria bacterium]
MKRNSSIPLIFFAFLTASNFAQATDLKTVQATMAPTPLEYVVDGTIEASKKSTVSSEITGRITELNFDIDNVVQKGEVLLRVRDNEYKARVQKAEASLDEAHAHYKDAELEFERAKDMYHKKVISESQFDRSQAALKAAEARVAASQA